MPTGNWSLTLRAALLLSSDPMLTSKSVAQPESIHSKTPRNHRRNRLQFVFPTEDQLNQLEQEAKPTRQLVVDRH
uniref:Uncharacterized protein n=1 Tax=Arundo donax TaxID=35708 RepID=A0A0A9EN86_ARUDO